MSRTLRRSFSIQRMRSPAAGVVLPAGSGMAMRGGEDGRAQDCSGDAVKTPGGITYSQLDDMSMLAHAKKVR